MPWAFFIARILTASLFANRLCINILYPVSTDERRGIDGTKTRSSYNLPGLDEVGVLLPRVKELVCHHHALVVRLEVPQSR